MSYLIIGTIVACIGYLVVRVGSWSDDDSAL